MLKKTTRDDFKAGEQWCQGKSLKTRSTQEAKLAKRILKHRRLAHSK
jgi:hypothetical protein